MMVSRKYGLFGSEIELFVEADEFISQPIMDEACTLALRLQKIFNIYDESSEISRLNKFRHILASKELLEVLISSLESCRLSGGDYDISYGKQFLQRKKGLPQAKVECSYKDIQIIGNEVKLLHPDVLLDLGSIAKGYIADKIALFFIEQGIESGYVNARGDIRMFGEPRVIGVQHPRMDKLLFSIKISDKGVATSGDYNQYIKNTDFSHILNKKEIISASVVSENLMDADVFATLLMVCSLEQREKIINSKGFPAMTVDKDLIIKYYNGFEELVTDEN